VTSIKGSALARAVITLTLNACVGTAVLAQTSHEFVAPTPLKQDGRFMPGFGSESIVRVRYTVKADGRLLTCEPAKVLPLAQRYFLF